METTLYLAKTIIALLINAKVAVATNFSHINDPWNPVPWAACLKRDLRETDVVIAHRTLPCKSKVFIYNFRTKKSVIAIVGDRGPRRAGLDLAPATTKALKANGMEIVLIHALSQLPSTRSP